MQSAGFWLALVMGLTVGGAGLLLLLRQVARAHLENAPRNPSNGQGQA